MVINRVYHGIFDWKIAISRTNSHWSLCLAPNSPGTPECGDHIPMSWSNPIDLARENDHKSYSKMLSTLFPNKPKWFWKPSMILSIFGNGSLSPPGNSQLEIEQAAVAPSSE